MRTFVATFTIEVDDDEEDDNGDLVTAKTIRDEILSNLQSVHYVHDAKGKVIEEA